MKRVTYGPRYVRTNYTVNVRGESSCAVLSNPALAASQVACYRDNRPSGTIVDVTYSERCEHCNGSGRKCTNRRTLAWKPCKACNGEPELFSYTFDPSEVATLMRHYQSAWLAA